MWRAMLVDGLEPVFGLVKSMCSLWCVCVCVFHSSRYCVGECDSVCGCVCWGVTVVMRSCNTSSTHDAMVVSVEI
jgi:hypothetical protein